MKIEDYRKKVDIFMTVFITYFFIICMSFEYTSVQSSYENYIMLTLVMIIALISYYTNVTFSLISVLAVDFVYSSYIFYRNIIKGISIDIKVYYWIIVIPITAVIVGILSQYILKLQIKLKKVNADNENLVMIDEATGIRNSSALFNEIPIYMSMSKRYELPVAIMLVRFKYSKKLKSIVGRDFFKNIIVKYSEIIEGSLRLEDRKYILNDADTFVFILIADEKGCEIVKKRLKNNLEKVNLDESNVFKDLKLEAEVGYYNYNENIKDAMDFVAKAEKEIYYDV
ncbi:diguanylate cyclase [Clostridium fermenticellae]|uniref:Diguanylate cyclase n=1 Tax=Clostridium fermenticellae TaxID=2068654 RepID=A0A386H4L8_9CLOT|nr:diguanylate cyclase [Clostridium fermenticellae]AYD40435.1 diguanylate cyclase [Clostridium fermenticellae]